MFPEKWKMENGKCKDSVFKIQDSIFIFRFPFSIFRSIDISRL